MKARPSTGNKNCFLQTLFGISITEMFRPRINGKHCANDERTARVAAITALLVVMKALLLSGATIAIRRLAEIIRWKRLPRYHIARPI